MSGLSVDVLQAGGACGRVGEQKARELQEYRAGYTLGEQIREHQSAGDVSRAHDAFIDQVAKELSGAEDVLGILESDVQGWSRSGQAG